VEEWCAAINGIFALERRSAPGNTDAINDVRAKLELGSRIFRIAITAQGCIRMLANVSPTIRRKTSERKDRFLGGFMKINKGAGLTMSEIVPPCRWRD